MSPFSDKSTNPDSPGSSAPEAREAAVEEGAVEAPEPPELASLTTTPRPIVDTRTAARVEPVPTGATAGGPARRARAVHVPEVRGLTAQEAIAAVRAAGLRANPDRVDIDDAASDGLVVTVAPDAGTELARQSSVDILVGSYATEGPVDAPTAAQTTWLGVGHPALADERTVRSTWAALENTHRWPTREDTNETGIAVEDSGAVELSDGPEPDDELDREVPDDGDADEEFRPRVGRGCRLGASTTRRRQRRLAVAALAAAVLVVLAASGGRPATPRSDTAAKPPVKPRSTHPVSGQRSIARPAIHRHRRVVHPPHRRRRSPPHHVPRSAPPPTRAASAPTPASTSTPALAPTAAPTPAAGPAPRPPVHRANPSYSPDFFTPGP